MNFLFPLNLPCLKIENAFKSRKYRKQETMKEEEEEKKTLMHAMHFAVSRIEWDTKNT